MEDLGPKVHAQLHRCLNFRDGWVEEMVVEGMMTWDVLGGQSVGASEPCFRHKKKHQKVTWGMIETLLICALGCQAVHLAMA